MKNLLLLLLFAMSSVAYSQVFTNSNQASLSIGASILDDNVGLYVSYQEKIGQYLGLGINGIYGLSNKEIDLGEAGTYKLKFQDRADLKAMLNIHLEKVFDSEHKFDVYPGLNIGLHNLGFHTGAKYYFADGFSVFGEGNIAISKFDENAYTPYNKFYFTVGVNLLLE